MHTETLPVVITAHCPLSSKFTFSKSTPYIRRCLEIIESARITWGYYSDEYKSCCYEIVDGEEVPKKFPPYSALKLTSARSIQSWYIEHSDLILTSQKTPEAIKKAVQDARRGIEKEITDKEILAVFAICEAFGAIYNIQCGKSEDAIKEKVLTASTFLNLAKTGLEPEKKDTPVSTPQKQGKTKDVIHFPTPPGTQWHEVKISFIDNENVKISARDVTEKKNYAEMGFKDKKTCKPVKSWEILLSFSENQYLMYPHNIKSKIEKSIQDLRKRLKAYFGIQDDPIILEHGYKPIFKVCMIETESRSVYASTNSDCLDEKKDN